ncbi:rna-directed dna polymerase from mobile element jockey-like [Willisornis vidua]|uniref:Rna-directed dna polymerase from mobile element jockey-like n=1 Tax=Willisornis vidua TaxID=1566151 RepID=A0ABQ9DJQ3_9PASS|nr:rna-directed dna polymerase from mobile element jockey-like [Willisornis vidua]
MDHSVDEEVVEYLHSKCCGQWLNVMSDIPQGLVLGSARFEIFVSNMESGIKCILSKFFNESKLSGGVSVLEGRDAIQSGLDRAESKTPPGVLSPALVPPTKGHGNLLEWVQRRARMMITGQEHLSYEDREIWGC